MRLIMISDTHCKRPRLTDGDVLIHAGDLTHLGTFGELKAEVKWLKNLPHARKLYVPGNHDWCVENIVSAGKLARLQEFLCPIELLLDSAVTINGLKFWGSPFIPPYAGGFNLSHAELKAKWSLIPNDVDVLITHGPPAGILDGGIGCEELFKAVRRLSPKVHAFGHVHDCAGHVSGETTDFYNCSRGEYVSEANR